MALGFAALERQAFSLYLAIVWIYDQDTTEEFGRLVFRAEYCTYVRILCEALVLLLGRVSTEKGLNLCSTDDC